jgi:hypothetical protein
VDQERLVALYRVMEDFDEGDRTNIAILELAHNLFQHEEAEFPARFGFMIAGIQREYDELKAELARRFEEVLAAKFPGR